MIFGNHRGTGLMGAASAIHAVVVVAVLAALLRSPTGKKITSCPQALNKNRSRIRWASLVEGSVLLVSACKVAVPNVEGSGLTDMGRGQWRWWKCRQRPWPQKCAPGIISILLEHNDKVLHRNCTTHGYSRRRTLSTLFIVRV